MDCKEKVINLAKAQFKNPDNFLEFIRLQEAKAERMRQRTRLSESKPRINYKGE